MKETIESLRERLELEVEKVAQLERDLADTNNGVMLKQTQELEKRLYAILTESKEAIRFMSRLGYFANEEDTFGRGMIAGLLGVVKRIFKHTLLEPAEAEALGKVLLRVPLTSQEEPKERP